MSGNNTTIGGPSGDRENRIRKGQIDWVVGLERASDYKSWSFKFKMGAEIYLSKEVYPKDEDRRFAWVNALIRASALGRYQELCDEVELLDSSGIRCEMLLEKLEKRYLPALDIEKKKTTSKYLSFCRGKSTLLESFKNMQQILLECRKYGYDPGKETQLAKLDELILSEDRPIFRLYVDREKAKDGTNSLSELDLTISAIEALGKDLDEKTLKGSRNDEQFAGGAFKKRHESRKAGYGQQDPKRSGFRSEIKTGSKQTCKKCGFNCNAVKGQGKCPAAEKECRKCGKIGHFESVCFSKTKQIKTGEQIEKKTQKAGTAVPKEDLKECFQ